MDEVKRHRSNIGSKVGRFIDENPWLVAVAVFVLIVIPGFIRVTDITDKQETQQNINRESITCLISYAVDLTDALQDRDAVNSTSRAASIELWEAIEKQFRDPSPTPRRSFLQAINRYQRALKLVTQTAAINPYPDLAPCLNEVLDVNSEADSALVNFVLTAGSPGFPAKYDDKCFDRRVTIYGSKGADVIHGTDRKDVIFAYSGGDLIVTGKGNDLVCARAGADIINSGQDRDLVDCGKGFDIALSAEVQYRCE